MSKLIIENNNTVLITSEAFPNTVGQISIGVGSSLEYNGNIITQGNYNVVNGELVPVVSALGQSDVSSVPNDIAE